MAGCTASSVRMISPWTAANSSSVSSAPWRVAMNSRRLRTGHFMPFDRSNPGACFWIATLVRCTKVLPMSSLRMLKRVLVKRANPLLRRGPGARALLVKEARTLPCQARAARAWSMHERPSGDENLKALATVGACYCARLYR